MSLIPHDPPRTLTRQLLKKIVRKSLEALAASDCQGSTPGQFLRSFSVFGGAERSVALSTPLPIHVDILPRSEIICRHPSLNSRYGTVHRLAQATLGPGHHDSL